MTSTAEPPRQTPLRAAHERLGATMTPFAGWRMPLRYASETAEHLAVRRAAGLFDLSHMGEITVTGPGAGAALDYALTGHLSAVPPGRARYTMVCADDGGVLDDLVVYRQGEREFLVIANAANTATVFGALRDRAASAVGPGAVVIDATGEVALVAIQGPAAAAILGPLTDADLGTLRYYAGVFGDVAGRRCWVARTGYTGEDGFELFCRPADAERIWGALEAAGAGAGLRPAGLAARDTLRLEAGMPLYGNELGPDMTPYEAGLGRVVKLDKPGDFVGRDALAARAAQPPRRKLAGLTIASRRVPRHGYPVLADDPGPAAAGGKASSAAAGGKASSAAAGGKASSAAAGGKASSAASAGSPGKRRVGAVTSGAPSPTLGVPIAMAYLDGDAAAGDLALAVEIRGEAVPARLTDLPFYRRRQQR